MTEINVRSDSVDVEQIMRQIRARIREKRGVDYTEAELQQLAKVKLEKFLDPQGVRSDLVDQFKKQRPVPVSPPLPTYTFDSDTLYKTHRGALGALRGWLRPILKLFVNPESLVPVLHTQIDINKQVEEWLRRLEKREEREALYYEIIHNLTLEVTRLGIDVHNLKMRVESISSRLDFDERRSRSLETVVQYKPSAVQRAPQPTAEAAPATGDRPASAAPVPGGPGGQPDGQRRDESAAPGGQRRRRRRRRRRPGQTLADGGRPTGPADTGAEAAGGDALAETGDFADVEGSSESDESDAPDQ